MGKICKIEDCERPHFGQGLCGLHYSRLIRKPKKELRMATCAWCGVRKPLSELRHPDSSRGKTPSSCNQCRESNPELAWCDFHGKPEPKGGFTPRPSRPIGVDNECVAANSIRTSKRASYDPIKCASCGDIKESWNYRGGRAKCPNCRDCEASHPDQHWCRDCADWLPKQMFVATGKDGKFWTVRCRPCRTANSHGVTVRQVLEKQGVASPECAACGSTDFLYIDHDHRHCPTANGCVECVRGYLCHQCNTAEGLLQTPERVRMLGEYMERHSIGKVCI